MHRRTIAFVLAGALGLYGAYRGVSCVLRSDRDRVVEVVDTLTSSFAEGDLSSLLGCLTVDFEALWRRQSYSREDIADHMRVVFVQGGRLVLEGGIRSIEIEPEGEKGSAVVVWEGEARHKAAGATTYQDVLHRGTGVLRLCKVGGSWLLASAEARPER